MVIKDLERFEELAKSCGNHYLAIRWISQWARELGSEYSDYQISESKLLEWVVSGKCPYLENQLEARRVICTDDGISDFLEWVMDDEIVDEVKSLYKQSVRKHKLQTCKRTDFNQYRISRTNILLRMIWYSTNKRKGE